MRGFACAVVALVMGMYCVGYGQEQKGPAGGPPAQPPREGRPPGGGPGGMAPEMRQKFEQLRNVDQRLWEAQAKAIEANPELQAMRQEIRDSFDALIEKVRTFEQKVDDAVVKAPPDWEQLVKEKRQVLGELEEQAGPGKNMLWMSRLRALLGGPGPGGPGGPGGGRPPGEGPGPAPGAPAAPPAQQK